MRRRRKNRKRKEFKCTRYVLLKDVPSMPRKEEYVGVTEQRTKLRNAATTDVPTLLREEEYVSCMVPRRSSAAMKGVPIVPRKEECVSGMVQRYYVKLAVMKDAPTNQFKEEYVGYMVQSSSVKLAVKKDATMNACFVWYVKGRRVEYRTTQKHIT